MTLSEVAQKTRIGSRFLKAIEEEEFDQLPGGIFNKSFIQQYAQFLGLDEKQAVRDYLRATATIRESQYPQPAHESRASLLATSGVMMRLAWGVVAVVLLAGIVWMVVPRSEAPRESPLAAIPAAPATIPQPEPVRSNTEPAAPTASLATTIEGPVETEPDRSPIESSESDPGAMSLPAQTSPAPSPAELLQAAGERVPLAGELPEELLLQINARSTVWISITADGEQQWQGTLQADQSRQVQASDTIRLTVGNAGGVQLTLNGKDLGSLGGEGEVKTVTLAARALQESTP